MVKRKEVILGVLFLVLLIGYFSFSSKDVDLAPVVISSIPSNNVVASAASWCGCLVGDTLTKGDIKLSDGSWPEPCATPDEKPGHLVRKQTCIEGSCVKMKRNAVVLDGVWGSETLQCVRN